ncbi:TPA: hypothetical protein ACKQDZ_000042 [Serratia rubidaea]
MLNIDGILNKANSADFFSNMGMPDILDEKIILIKNVENAFINPSDLEFKGLYNSVEWLPTSATQDDPFYKKQNIPKELSLIRVKISKIITESVKNTSKDKFICLPHDFSQAAKNGICFAFRQYVSERYLELGNKWENIVNIYYARHWPIGFSKNHIVAI